MFLSDHWFDKVISPISINCQKFMPKVEANSNPNWKTWYNVSSVYMCNRMSSKACTLSFCAYSLLRRSLRCYCVSKWKNIFLSTLLPTNSSRWATATNLFTLKNTPLQRSVTRFTAALLMTTSSLVHIYASASSLSETCHLLLWNFLAPCTALVISGAPFHMVERRTYIGKESVKGKEFTTYKWNNSS